MIHDDTKYIKIQMYQHKKLRKRLRIILFLLSLH